MPLYDFECPSCRTIQEHHTACDGPPPACACGQTMERLISAPRVVRISGPSGPIYSDRQIEAEYGPRWRDTGTTGKEGGAGAGGRLFFDGCRR
jgi:putative FmdB family regulatory protein